MILGWCFSVDVLMVSGCGELLLMWICGLG